MSNATRHFVATFFAIAVLSIAATAQATTLYASSYEGSSLWKVDTVALTATSIWSTTGAGQQPDSLTFDGSGNILYSAHFPGGGVRKVNLTANTDTSIASWTGHTTDLALEPSLSTVLASNYNVPELRRVNLSGGSTLLASGTDYYSGLAYVGNRLFANIGTINQHGGNQIKELNPTNAAVINTSIANPAGVNTVGDLDGLTYDTFTGHLWAPDEDAGKLIEINPNTLATTVHNLPATAAGGSLMPDGICGDGLGKLWYASRGDFNIYEYNITTGLSTPVVNIYGLDDLAPASGLGSVPEPSSMALLVLVSPYFIRRHRRG